MSPSSLGLPRCCAAESDATNRGVSAPTEWRKLWQIDATLHDVTFVDGRGWAVGDRGVIWHTTDGQHWTRQKSGIDATLRTVCFVDDKRGWAAGGKALPGVGYGRGLVLHTSDGGKNWLPLADGTLPIVHRIGFFDRSNGWAVTSPSPDAPAGLLTTRDGGKNWLPVASTMTAPLRSGAFWRPGRGVVGGKAGTVAVSTNDRLLPSRTGGLGRRCVADIALVPPSYGWLVGEGGLVRVTPDAGQSWRVPAGTLPEDTDELFDFAAVAVVGPNVWIAGDPGSAVLHSHDAGESWQVLPTGSSLPIRGLHFVDEKRGWAVGALGTILHTQDGGTTWQRQEAGGIRAALWAGCGTTEHIPWELLAKYAGEEGYLAAVEVLIDEGQPGAKSSADADIRLQDALLATGGSAACQGWRFPLSEPAVHVSDEKLLAEWDRLHDGAARRRLLARLVRSLRTWQPEVAVFPQPDPTRHDPVAWILADVLPEALAQAGDPTAFAQQITTAHLAPWRPKRAFAIGRVADRDNAITLMANEYGARLGGTYAEVARRARRVLGEVPAQPPDRYHLQPVAIGGETPRSLPDLFSGLVLAPGAGARRVWGETDPRDTSAATAAAARRNAEAALRVVASGDMPAAALLAEFDSMTGELDDQAAVDWLLRVAQRYRAAGRWRAYADTLEAVARRYPDQELFPAVAETLLQLYASGEVRWQVQGSQRVWHSGGAAPAIEASRADDYLQRAAEWGRKLAQSDKQWTKSAAIAFPRAITARQRGYGNDAAQLLMRLSYRQEGDSWRACAQMEAWLAQQPSEVPPKPVVSAHKASEKPYLDGRGDDPAWQRGQPLRLTGKANDEGGAAELRFCYDDEFLYLLAECPKHPEVSYPPAAETPPRKRDADLSACDRIAWRIDIDRDYSTWYRLAVDCRGFPQDECWGQESWDPTWFVAHDSDTRLWRAEAAIPLEELTPRFPRPGDAWAVSVERVIPDVGVESSAPDGSARSSPADFVLLLFQ